jgi:hypothetical protein
MSPSKVKYPTGKVIFTPVPRNPFGFAPSTPQKAPSVWLGSSKDVKAGADQFARKRTRTTR